MDLTLRLRSSQEMNISRPYVLDQAHYEEDVVAKSDNRAILCYNALDYEKLLVNGRRVLVSLEGQLVSTGVGDWGPPCARLRNNSTQRFRTQP